MNEKVKPLSCKVMVGSKVLQQPFYEAAPLTELEKRSPTNDPRVKKLRI